MTIQRYTRPVECDDPGIPPTQYGPLDACQSVLNKMKVSTWSQVFGRAGDQGVQESLPMSIVDGQST